MAGPSFTTFGTSPSRRRRSRKHPLCRRPRDSAAHVVASNTFLDEYNDDASLRLTNTTATRVFDNCFGSCSPKSNGPAMAQCDHIDAVRP